MPLRLLRIFLFNLSKKNSVSYKAKVGFGFYAVNSIMIKKQVKVENFIYLNINSVQLEEAAILRRLSVFKGPFDLELSKKCGIGKGNKVIRSNHPVVSGASKLYLGEGTILNSNHYLDLTKSITFGKDTVLAGRGSQLWTHGYYHADEGTDRIRIDGEIVIGDNVYIGSGCTFNPSVKVANAIHLGAGSCISKNLDKKGMYVNQGLRHIDNNIEAIKSKLTKVDDPNLIENVYFKE